LKLNQPVVYLLCALGISLSCFVGYFGIGALVKGAYLPSAFILFGAASCLAFSLRVLFRPSRNSIGFLLTGFLLALFTIVQFFLERYLVAKFGPPGGLGTPSQRYFDIFRIAFPLLYLVLVFWSVKTLMNCWKSEDT